MMDGASKEIKDLLKLMKQSFRRIFMKLSETKKMVK